MRDLNRQFEDKWKQAFDGAGMEPSSSVWSNIELDLVRGESDTMKKKVVFYKRLAAASVFLVVFLGGTFYYSSTTNETPIAANKGLTQSPNKTKDNSNSGSEGSKGGQNPPRGTIAEANDGKGFSLSEPDQSTQGTGTLIHDEKSEDALNTLVNAQNYVSKRTHQAVSLASIVEDVPAVVQGKVELPRLVLPAMPASFMASAKKTNSEKEDLWASVGVSAGSYNPDYSAGGGAAFDQASTQGAYLNSRGHSTTSDVGSARSAGFAMSKRIFNRWVVQSGLNYVNQSTQYTSNYLAVSASNQTKAFVAEYADFANQSVTITSPYQINSAVEVVSMPLQTGYLLVDRKIGWQLNTGVAADFFIRNTLTDPSGNVDSFSRSTGENSPYKAVSWAGLLGTELSYKVGRQYRLSVVPSMRYSVNSVLKSSTGQSSNPLVMDVGFRFRYIFK